MTNREKDLGGRLVLRDVDRILSKPEDWVQCAYSRDGNRFCLYGALDKALHARFPNYVPDKNPGKTTVEHYTRVDFYQDVTRESQAARYAASKALDSATYRLFRHRGTTGEGSARCVSYVTFNDHPKTTFQDVKEVIALAIQIVKEEPLP